MATEHLRVSAKHKTTAVTTFATMDEVVLAVRALHEQGLTNEQISLLARDEAAVGRAIDQVGAVNGQEIEPADTLAEEVEPKGRDEAVGMAIGGAVGFVIGLGAVAIPGFGGFLLAAGPLAIALNALTVSAAGVGLGAVMGAIFDERVTEEHRDMYKEKLESGEWILVVHGDNDDIERAAGVFSRLGREHVDAF